MRESELLEGNRFVRGIKKIHDRLLAMVRLYDQLRSAHCILSVAWRQTLLLNLDLNRLREASLIPLSLGISCDRPQSGKACSEPEVKLAVNARNCLQRHSRK